MKLLRRSSFALVSLALLAGCGGGGAKPPAAPAKSGDAVMPTEHITSEARPDLSPVPAPEGLIAVARITNPGGLADRALGWTGLPLDWRALLTKKDPDLLRVLAPAASIDAALVLDPASSDDDPKFLAAVSVPLSSLDLALELARKNSASVQMVRPGVYRASMHGSDCALAAAAGPAPARLVCGDNDAQVDALLPYVTRTLPTERLTSSDIHFEFRAAPVQMRYVPQLRRLRQMALGALLGKLELDSPAFDRALSDVVHSVADEALTLVEELDTFAIDAWLRDDPALIEAKASLRFKGSSSWAVQTLLDAGKRAAPPSDMFWRLPADAGAASFSVGAAPKRFEPIGHTLGELADGYLAHEKMPRKTRDQVVDLLEGLFSLSSGAVTAHGSLPAATAGRDQPVESGASAREKFRSMLGWYVIGVDVQAETYRKLLGTLMSVFNDPQLRKPLGVDAKLFPKLTTRAARGAGLAPGSKAYVLTLPGELLKDFDGPSFVEGEAGPRKKQVVPAPLSIVLILMPDGARTWLGISTDEAVLSAKLAQVRKPAGDQSLEKRAGLGALRTGKVISGGFMTVAGVLDSPNALSELGISPGTLLRAAPHHGETPILMSFTVEPGAAPSLVWRSTTPRAVVEDLATIGTSVAGGLPVKP
ncbi:MAG: hypothetical protein OZ921_16590 [Sorangiineae bacterium]|nr:hypothetical protein [Polyangiaceae bacterium]MEB2324132.1 hypothetical protein [Sorangiineae bacterium]